MVQTRDLASREKEDVQAEQTSQETGLARSRRKRIRSAGGCPSSKHNAFVPCYFFNTPINNNTADSPKMKGHNLNGKKSIRKPVNSERTAIATSIMADST